jgi:hypothetical protein
MKKLNTDSITNELVNSSFFPKTPQKREEVTPMPPQRTPLKSVDLVSSLPTVKPLPIKPAPVAKPVPAAVPAPAPAGRRFVRRTFDFYEDQISYLTKASLEDRLAGKDSSMNSMVREAVDSFIRERRKKEGLREDR